MNRPFITVPPGLFRYQSVDWDIDWREQAGPSSVGGRRNINMQRLPRWIAAPGVLFTPATIPQWRAHRWAGRGMTGIFRIQMCDPVGFRQPALAGVSFDDGSPFEDGTGFAGEYTVRCDAGAAAGATEVVVNMASATGPIIVGQILSHNDWPFGVIEVDGNTLRVEMPLRQAIPAGDLIQLRGTGLFEMAEARSGNPAYDTSRISRVTMSLQEWLR